MALINIEYGSLASSEILNKNFMYLDDKIAETSESILTSVSSILSNIATINGRLNDITEMITDSIEGLSTTLEDYKSKVKILVNEASMVPNWSGVVSVKLSSTKAYVAPSNGYLLLKTDVTTVGNIVINGSTLPLKTCASAYEANSLLTAYPLQENDKVTSNATFTNVYFLPAKEVSIENF